jgi:peptidoglycan/xylan/chitin deacetylase (PgdA/CDA1 family)
MSYYNKYPFFHGIMFHHLHDDKTYKDSQGSISTENFYKIIDLIGEKNILDANEFLDRLKSNKLEKKNVCLTFDDSLKSQFVLGKKLLNSIKKKAFFFVYTSIFKDIKSNLELYRHFRNNYFSSINEFYNLFFLLTEDILKININKYIINKKLRIYGYTLNEWKKNFSYFSNDDIKFRITRDSILSKKKYDFIMRSLFKIKNFDFKNEEKKLFLSKSNIIELKKSGHEIGLHSHSHPFLISKLDYNKQMAEYSTNKKILEAISKNSKIRSMSHPCGSYDKNTLKILEKLNIDIGFKQIMKPDNKKKINDSNLEIARHDSPAILRMLKI